MSHNTPMVYDGAMQGYPFDIPTVVIPVAANPALPLTPTPVAAITATNVVANQAVGPQAYLAEKEAAEYNANAQVLRDIITRPDWQAYLAAHRERAAKFNPKGRPALFTDASLIELVLDRPWSPYTREVVDDFVKAIAHQSGLAAKLAEEDAELAAVAVANAPKLEAKALANREAQRRFRLRQKLIEKASEENAQLEAARLAWKTAKDKAAKAKEDWDNYVRSCKAAYTNLLKEVDKKANDRKLQEEQDRLLEERVAEASRLAAIAEEAQAAGTIPSPPAN